MIRYVYRRMFVIVTYIVPFLMLQICHGQILNLDKEVLSDTIYGSSKKSVLKKTNLGIEVNALILPQARIMRYEGNYILRSHLQSAYDLGINYLYSITKSSVVSIGIHLIVGKKNYFIEIPNTDIPGFSDGSALLENKGLWTLTKIPLYIEQKVKESNKNLLTIKAGVNFKYSGFVLDESHQHILYDSNNNPINVLQADFSGRNNGKVWVTFLIAGSKHFLLDNKNFLAVGLQADVSATNFYKGVYFVTVPNKPISSGSYEISGTSLGISIQYIFTGANRRLIRNYQKREF